MVEITYKVNNVLALLKRYKQIQEDAYYSGIMDGINVKIDLDLLIKKAKLTDRQYQVVEQYYFEQKTQKETAQVLGISQQGVTDHLNSIKKKITKVAKIWEVLDSEY